MVAKKKNAKKTKASRRNRKTTSAPSKRKLTKRRPVKKQSKKRAAKKKTSRRSPAGRDGRRRVPRQSARSGEQSGDLQGIRARAGADSESVNELLQEGNTFEAGVVKAWRMRTATKDKRSEPVKCRRMMFPANTWMNNRSSYGKRSPNS